MRKEKHGWMANKDDNIVCIQTCNERPSDGLIIITFLPRLQYYRPISLSLDLFKT
ncbi:hypothetical protein SAMN05421736_105200 [Evansella caseinilytica]|uniref:Uncharacterized protein n=1 Tax=Evansella caseinilytica TaxID=1503961 RepID=A0A1H3PTU2_9BACI|nr:hypothetical protein SAMN05421736_105200 [Evansella caseinilytica]